MESFIFLIVLLQPCIVDAFLLNSTQTGLTSFEFQHLSQLIINEEQSRHHVENEVTSLEQRIVEIEHDFKTKYEDEIAATKRAVERQINATKTEFENKIKLIKTSLEEEANLTKAAFERELNTTKLTREQQRLALEQQNRTLEKEKSNSRYLEREYTRLMMDFHNLSLAYDSLVSKDMTLNFNIETINSSINLLKSNVSGLNKVVSKNSASFVSNEAKLSALNASTASLSTKAGYQSAFTVEGPARNGTVTKGGGIAGLSIILTGVKYNVGGHYNVSSGTFTCVYSGIYFFTLNIYKTSSANAAWCRIRKNGIWLVVITAEPRGTTWNGYLEGGGSLVIHLVSGDTVDIAGCTSANTIHEYTSFTGILLQPD